MKTLMFFFFLAHALLGLTNAQNLPRHTEQFMAELNFLSSNTKSGNLHEVFEYKPFDLKSYLLQWLNPLDWSSNSSEMLLRKKALLRQNHSFHPSETRFLSDGVQAAWVRHYASGLVTGINVAVAMTVDESGNLYTTGYSSANAFGVDYFTAKYDTSGALIWSARYDGGNGDDFASSIAIDISGNVYVTGRSWAMDSFYDYATVKYKADGLQEWVARYDGGEYDSAIDLAVDHWGDVYVTGSSLTQTYLDFTTVMYNSTGQRRWVAHYNNPSDGNDIAVGLELDRAGNVYVTGNSEVLGSSHYTTIKYNSGGTAQWVGRYHGPAVFNRDEVSALVLDEAGNVYVTGRSMGVFSNYDYATVKYNAAGDQEWVARYNGLSYGIDEAVDIAIDHHDTSGGIYVTGRSYVYGANYDYVTIKYDFFGEKQWEANFNNPLNSDDIASAITVDDSGHVLVTGNSLGANNNIDIVTVQYDSNGMEQWVARYDNPSNGWNEAREIAVHHDSIGVNFYVLGWNHSMAYNNHLLDHTIIKYDSAGIEQRVTESINPQNSYDSPRAAGMDKFGNFYVAGLSYTETGVEYATVKYNTEGVEEWLARYRGPGNVDYVVALAVDNDCNAYVTGISWTGSFFDYATVKYNSAGVEQWVARFDGPIDDWHFGYGAWTVDLGVDGSGNVYVAGGKFSSIAFSGVICITTKYNDAGVQEWVAELYGPQFRGATATALAVDQSGNVFVTGVVPTEVGKLVGFVVKYNTSGVQQWNVGYGGSGEEWNEPKAIAVDAEGNVLVTGWSVGRGTDRDYMTIKYDTDGTTQWLARYNGPTNYPDEPSALIVDNSGNVCVTGYSSMMGAYNYATVKYDRAGAQKWVDLYAGPDGSFSDASAMALDDLGNVYVTGLSWAPSTASDYATIKYNPDGGREWIARFSNPGNSSEAANGVAVDHKGNVFVTGSSYGIDSPWSIYTTIKYVQTPKVSVEGKKIKLPSRYELSQNYPNPFNPTTTIRYAIPNASAVLLKVYNVAGHEVVTLVDEKKSAGEYEVNWNAGDLSSGVYVYRLQAGDYVESRKLLMLK